LPLESKKYPNNRQPVAQGKRKGEKKKEVRTLLMALRAKKNKKWVQADAAGSKRREEEFQTHLYARIKSQAETRNPETHELHHKTAPKSARAHRGKKRWEERLTANWG